MVAHLPSSGMSGTAPSCDICGEGSRGAAAGGGGGGEGGQNLLMKKIQHPGQQQQQQLFSHSSPSS